MKPFIYSLIFIFSINISLSQTRELVLKESYSSDENTILDIDVDNVSIILEESMDNKVHFDYSILFRKNSEEVLYKVFKGIKAKSSKTNNIIKLDVKNSMYLGELYSLDVDIETYKEHIRELFKSRKKNEFLYKSKDSVLEEISFSLGSDTNDYFKKLKLENPKKDFGKSARTFRQHFIIKVPRNVKINIKALHSKIDFTFDVNTPLDLSSFKTYYKFKNINNKRNTFKLMSGIFQAEEISGGNYDFKDIYKVRIGSILNSSLNTETSRIQIGEVGVNVSVIDSNSKLHLYNFSDSFNNFDLKGDYSELNFYNVLQNNVPLSIFGYNTVLNMDNIKTTFGNATDEKLIKILEKKEKSNEKSSGKITIELKNGVLNIK